MKPPARVRLRLLGRFSLTLDSDPDDLIEISSRKVMAIVAYLAMQPEQSASREQLAALLWGDSSDQQARHSLRQALALLRRNLPWPHLFVIRRDSIGFQAGAWSVDAHEFDMLAKSNDTSDLVRAGQLFRGEFLAGLAIDEKAFDEWLRDQRQRIELAGTQLCEIYASRPQLSDSHEAIAFAERIIAIDPLREDLWRWALTLHARHRGRGEALAQAKTLIETLQRELGDKPEPETLALIDAIRGGAIALAQPYEPTLSPPVAPIASPSQAGSCIAPLEGPVLPFGSRTLPAPPAGLMFPWKFRQWSRRTMSASLAGTALIVAAGIGLLMHNRSLPAHVGDPMSSVSVAMPASIADPWQSPRLPSQRDAEPPDRNNVAILVLPFTTYGETAGSLQMLADQLTDDVTNLLSRVPGLRVISRNTARSYLGRSIDIAAIGAELNVGYVLEGNISRTGDKLRLNTELINPKTRLPVWSDRIERDVADIHTVQDEIVGRLGRELQFSVMLAEAEQSAYPDVRTLVLKGWAAVFSAGIRGMEGARLGKPYFEEALQRDPSNISAKIGLAAILLTFSAHELGENRETSLTEAEALLRDALGRNPNLSAANYFMSVVHRLRARLPDALDSLKRAVEHNPSHASSYAHLGFILTRMGRAAEGLEHIRYAIRLSPKDPILSFWLNYAGAAELELARNSDAIEHFRQALALYPRYGLAWAGLAAAYALSGSIEKAGQAVAKLHALFPDVSNEDLLARLGPQRSHPLRFTEGLRLAFDYASNGAH